MWIQNQNDNFLGKIDGLWIVTSGKETTIQGEKPNGQLVVLATYSSKEKANKVMKMIHDYIINFHKEDIYSRCPDMNVRFVEGIFKMPKDADVFNES